MGDKIYDYNLYTWKDLQLIKDRFSVDGIAESFGLNAEDIVFDGVRVFLGNYWKVSAGFQITIKNLDSQFWLLKARANNGETIHPEAQSGNQVVLTFPACTVSELSLGEITEHKVYNSYRWWNQDTQTQESYWPYGCTLKTKLDSNLAAVRIDNDTEEYTLKRYSIPKFYTDDLSISGYGWYRAAMNKELLAERSGYQTTRNLKPFGTYKPKQMLFLTKQLRDPGITILYNGWDWGNKTAQELKATCQIQDDKVLINNQHVYTLEAGDVLVRYSVSDELISNNDASIYGPYGIPATESAYVPEEINPRRPLGDSRFYVVGNPANPYAFATLSIYSQKTLLSVAYNCSLPAVTITELTPQGEQTPNNELYQLYKAPIKYSNWKAQTLHVLSSPTTLSTFESSVIAWGRYEVQSALSFELKVNITNIPSFAKTWTPNMDFVTASRVLTCSTGPFASHDSADLVYAWNNYYKVSCALFEQWWFPVIHTETFSSVDASVLGYDFHARFWPCAGIIPNIEDFHPTLQYYPGEETDRIFSPNIFSLYVVWHFVMPLDETT